MANGLALQASRWGSEHDLDIKVWDSINFFNVLILDYVEQTILDS